MKIWRSLIAIIVTLALCVCPTLAYEQQDSITIHFDVKKIPTLIQGGVVIEMQDMDGKLIDYRIGEISKINPHFDLTFNVGELSAGKQFYVVLASGAKSIEYGEISADKHLIQISADQESGKLINEFSMGLTPAWNKTTSIRLGGRTQSFEHYIVGDEIFVTYDMLNSLGIKYTFNEKDEHPNVFLSSQPGGYTMQFYMNNIYAVRGGVGYNLSEAPFVKNGKPFIPLRDLAIYFACNYNENGSSEYQRIVNVSPSAYLAPAETVPVDSKAAYVNSRNLNSKTDYLVWVSKSDFKVNVYLGENGAWRFVKSFDCAIGAPSTPTIEGVFEYYQWQPRWTYNNYYCGPILRFYKGYAIHSTLIKYNGVPYDNRVGVKISHGCVRVRPEGIQWLSDYIPLGTTILVTG